MISILFAASLSFTATATGVEKGTPIEFLFAGKDTDRDYETMFVLDEPVGDLCARLEKAGLPRGRATDRRACVLWPVGCRIQIEPALSRFVETKWPEGLSPAEFIYTGGTRNEKGGVVASDEMPLAFCTLYSLAQSPIVFDGVYPQGDVYGAHTAKVTLEKGARQTFTISWDEKTLPRHLDVTFAPGTAAQRLGEIRAAAQRGALEVLADFDPSLTVREATQIAQALAVIDTVSVKLNGRRDGRLFFRAFLPPVSWRDRQQRLTQPFELTLGLDGADTLVFVEEDWTVEGNDPKLTPKTISFDAAKEHATTDTCFIFAASTETLARLYTAMRKLKGVPILNWYVFASE